jgi:hypothetical protein
MRLADLSAKTLHGFLAIEEFSALGLGDTGRDLSSKLIVVLVEKSLAFAKKPHTLGEKLLERTIPAASEFAVDEGSKVLG